MDEYWKTGKCPECSEELSTEKYKEYRDTGVLIPMWEELTRWYCPYCGWNDDGR